MTTETIPAETIPAETVAATPAPEETALLNTPAEYDYVPAKFMTDGNPDFKKMSESYKSLETKMNSNLAPATAHEYTYDLNTDVFDQSGFNDFKTQAHELGLSQDQFHQLMDTYTTRMESLLPNNDFVETLKSDWGDQFDANVKNANKAFSVLDKLGMDAETAGKNPDVMKILSHFGSQMTEDSARNLQTAPTGLNEADVSKLMSDPAYYDNSPAGKTLRDQVQRYFEVQNA